MKCLMFHICRTEIDTFIIRSEFIVFWLRRFFVFHTFAIDTETPPKARIEMEFQFHISVLWHEFRFVTVTIVPPSLITFHLINGRVNRRHWTMVRPLECIPVAFVQHSRFGTICFILFPVESLAEMATVTATATTTTTKPIVFMVSCILHCVHSVC